MTIITTISEAKHPHCRCEPSMLSASDNVKHHIIKATIMAIGIIKCHSNVNVIILVTTYINHKALCDIQTSQKTLSKTNRQKDTHR